MKSTPRLLTAVLLLLLCSCSSQMARIEKTDIARETRISSLPEDDQKMLIGLSRGVDGYKNIFNEAEAVSVNGYRIVFTPGKDEIYIVKDKNVLAGVNENAISIYNNAPEAPSIGTETVYFEPNYIKYRGPSYQVFEDYGLDGIDVSYNLKNPTQAISYIPGKTCRTVVAGLACCQDGAKKPMQGYRFLPTAGWQPSASAHFNQTCKSISEQP